MPNGNKLSVNIEVCEHKFTLNILPEHEEAVRAAVKAINEKTSKLKERMPRRDMMDFLALVAVEYASEVILRQKDKDESQLVSRVKKLSDELDMILSE